MSTPGDFVAQYALLRDIHSDLEEIFEQEEIGTVMDQFTAVEKACLALVYRLHDIETNARALRLAVIGNFNAGKSSLINSLLGRSVCPVDVCPTTSSVTRFSYGPEPCVEQRGKGKITFEEYTHRVRHPTEPGVGANPILEFDVEYPYEVLRDLRIIDTPGFANVQNEHDTEITIQAAREADAIFFVLDINTGAIGADTLLTLERIRKGKSECPWTLVLNWSDRKPPDSRAKIQSRLAREYAQLFDHVVQYSSTWALESDAFGAQSWREMLTHAIEGASVAGLPLDLAVVGRPQEIGGFLLSIGERAYRLRFPLSEGVATAHEMRERIADLARHKHNAALAQLASARTHYLIEARTLVTSLSSLLDASKGVDPEFQPCSAEALNELNESGDRARYKMRQDFAEAWVTSLKVRLIPNDELPFWSKPFAEVALDDVCLVQLLTESAAWGYLHAALKEFVAAEDHEEDFKQRLEQMFRSGDEWERTKELFSSVVMSRAAHRCKKRLGVFNDNKVAEAVREKVSNLERNDLDYIVNPIWDAIVVGFVQKMLDAAKLYSFGAHREACFVLDWHGQVALEKTRELGRLLSEMEALDE